jgi:CHAD domain-containing protein
MPHVWLSDEAHELLRQARRIHEARAKRVGAVGRIRDTDVLQPALGAYVDALRRAAAAEPRPEAPLTRETRGTLDTREPS